MNFAKLAFVMSIGVSVSVPFPFATAQSGISNSESFQVATIKESDTDQSGGIAVRGNRFITSGTTVSDLAAYAYGLQKRQIVDGPSWIDKQRFDIFATLNHPKQDSNQTRAMVAALLQDRFAFAFNRAERMMPVTAILRIPGPLKLKRSDGASDPGASIGFTGPGSLTVSNASLTDFANLLQRYVADRPIIDQTAIEGKYDMTLVWNPDVLGAPTSASSSMEDRPDLNVAFKEQLGLRLLNKEALAPVLSIQHLDKPAPD